MQITPEAGIPLYSTNFAGIPVWERAKLACNTIRVLYPDDTEEDTNPSDADLEIARGVFGEVTSDVPVFNPAIASLYPNAAMKHLDKLLSQYDHELVNSAVRIREYVKNKLMLESDNADSKIRIKALELLGKMKDVGLFTDRVEVTHKTRTDEELNEELSTKLERYMGMAVLAAPDEDETEVIDDANIEEPTPVEDLIEGLNDIVGDVEGMQT